MLKALLRKQLQELSRFYFINRKTGKRKSKTSMLLTVFGFLLLFGLVSYALYGMAGMLSDALLTSSGETDWLYFALMGVIAFLMGVIGSAFQTFSTLYLAKDNELLLSMPIPPKYILLSRMLTVMLSAALFTALIWIPGIVKYALVQKGTGFFWPVLLLPFMILLATAFSCALGALVALISRKLKGKSIMRVVISLVLFAVYYLFVLRFRNVLTVLLTKTNEMMQAFRTWLFPLYWLGKGASGELVYLLAYIGMAVALFALCVLILSGSFQKTLGGLSQTGKRKRREQKDRRLSIRTSLLRREWRRYITSSAYVMNTIIGLIFLLGMTVFVYLNRVEIKVLLLSARMAGGIPKNIMALIPVAVFCVVSLMTVMCNLTASSVSLEGNRLWLIRSLPVRTIDILCAKRKLQMLMVMPIALLSVGVLSYSVGEKWYHILLLIATEALFVWIFADTGLLLNLKMPNFKWTNESMPIKQGAPVAIGLFGGWIVVAGIGALAYFARDFLPGFRFLLAMLAAEVLIVFLLELWLRKRGTLLLEKM